MRKLVLVSFLILMISFHIPPTLAQNDDPIMTDNKYRFELIAQQFSFQLIDLNRVDELIDEGLTLEEARNRSSYTNEVGNFIGGKQIFFTAYSIDVIHGITIPKLGISKSLEAPKDGEFIKYNLSATLPNEATEITGFCNYFCGEGHENMQIRLIVGHPSSDDGKILGVGIYGWLWVLSLFVVIILIVILVVKAPMLKKIT